VTSLLSLKLLLLNDDWKLESSQEDESRSKAGDSLNSWLQS